MGDNILKYEVVIHGNAQEVKSLEEAESKLKRIEYSDFSVSYILKKEYAPNGKLLEAYAIF